jgi:hypothetical protein
MVRPERESIESIALLVDNGDVSGLQKLVGAATWTSDDVMAEVRAAFADEFAPSAAGSPVVVGVSTGRPSPRRARRRLGHRRRGC